MYMCYFLSCFCLSHAYVDLQWSLYWVANYSAELFMPQNREWPHEGLVYELLVDIELDVSSWVFFLNLI